MMRLCLLLNGRDMAGLWSFWLLGSALLSINSSLCLCVSEVWMWVLMLLRVLVRSGSCIEAVSLEWKERSARRGVYLPADSLCCGLQCYKQN